MGITAKLFNSLWLFFVALGVYNLNLFTYTGKRAASVSIPKGSSLLSSTRPTLLVFLHPKCSCSKATVVELEKLLPTLEGVDVKVVMNVPAGRDLSWSSGDLKDQVSPLKYVTIVNDMGGAEALRFHASTSGHAMLIDAQKNLIYSGGLTPGRGHVGETQGHTVIRKWARTKNQTSTIEKIFGCDIFGVQV
jgi:hypothetical protein